MARRQWKDATVEIEVVPPGGGDPGTYTLTVREVPAAVLAEYEDMLSTQLGRMLEFLDKTCLVDGETPSEYLKADEIVPCYRGVMLFFAGAPPSSGSS